MRLKSTWFIFSFFFFSPWAFSQNQIDSLLNNLKKNLPDTEKIKTYLLLSGKYKATNYKKSVDYGLTALKISEAGNYKKQTTNSCKVLGKFFFEKERYDSALLYLNKSLLFIDAETDVLNYINVQKRIGTIYFYTSSYNNALEAFYQCLKFAEKIKDTKEIGHALANIGNVYKEESKYDEALVYYKRSKKYMLDLKDSSKLAPVYIDIGNVYYEYAKEKTKGVIYYDSSMAMYKSAEFILHNYTDSSVLSMLYCNMANIYADRGQFAAAIEKLKNSILIREKTQNFTQIAVQYQDLASIYLETHEYDLTKKYLDLGLEAASENNAYQDLATIYKDYAVYYAATNNYKKAYESSQLNKQYADSFFNEEDVEKRKELEMNFSFEKEREKQKLEEDKKELVHAEEKKRSLIYLLISVCGIVIVLFIALIVYRNFKRTQKAHIIISKQKNEIEIQKHFVEEKNKEVMDSIHYAKRIQRVLFTSENYFKKHLPDFFIVYKPKDIVSGDFYWALNLNQKFYLATADCTGHGVPGAFMSLLNISFLNEVVIEKKITRPDLILNEVRNDIIKALNPEGNEAAKDGMDCSVCCFDFENMELQVAAANNPVWIVRNNILTEIKPDKMPVGMYADDPKPFSLQTIKLEKGDIVYTFTDGYADQFGGPKGKKFKYKQLEEILLANSQKDFSAQKETLDKIFIEWKGTLEQVDDVLLIAVKI